MLAAVLFDWDGVVLDSEAQHKTSWERLAAELGHALPEDHMALTFGKRNDRILRDILGWADTPEAVHKLSERKEALYREAIAREPVAPLPGVRALLRGLRQAGIPCAVGSSTHRKNIECVIGALHLRPYFAGIAAGHEVRQGKPAPDIFRRAAEILKVPPQHCVVIEDSVFGLQAARAGGMKGLGVATTHPISHLKPADLRVHRLTEVSVKRLRALW